MPDDSGARPSPAVRAALGAACTSPMAIMVTLARTGPVPTVVYRCGLALPVLAGLAAAERRRRGPRPLASRGLAALAGFCLAVDLVLFNHAIADLGAGVATVLGNLSALFVAALAWALLGERPGRRYLLMLPVVLLGMLLVSGLAGGSGTGPHPAAGAGYALAVNAAYAYLMALATQEPAAAPPATRSHASPWNRLTGIEHQGRKQQEAGVTGPESSRSVPGHLPARPPAGWSWTKTARH